MTIEAFGHTDIGKKRELNEDNYLFFHTALNIPDIPKQFCLLAVADGIGGHAGGDIASTTAVNTLKENILHQLKLSSSSFQPKEVLEEVFQLANQTVFQKAIQNPDFIGMGTTLVAVLVIGNRATISNVGDSRAYLIRNESLSQITHDHSWKAEQLKAKKISEKDILKSPFKNMITRSLGFESDAKIDTFEIDLSDGDYLLLCTDGLYSFVSEYQILRIFRRLKKPEKICRKLIKLANKHGGHDNITGIVAYYSGRQVETNY